MYIISLSNLLQWAVRQTAELENTMTAAERNLEYTKLEQEPPRQSRRVLVNRNMSCIAAGSRMEEAKLRMDGRHKVE